MIKIYKMTSNNELHNTFLTKTEQQFLWKKYSNEAKDKCIDYCKAYNNCVKTNGIIAPINCWNKNIEMNECMDRNFAKILESHSLPPAQPYKQWYKKYTVV